MILVDTSVWIEFFRRGSAASRLAELLAEGGVLTHDFVVGEIALGSLGRRRAEVLRDLQLIPRLPVLPEREVLHLVETRGLSGAGIGWVDAHLLASAAAAARSLWTLDRRLGRAAARLAIAV
ncbi:MAG TPA: PIN domain-containing protein [Myxococcota bacterium]|nr:PIN domain-containing protein [Myxococcota bacterium]